MLCYVTLEHQAWQIFRRLIYFNTLTECYTPFFFLRMLFFRPRLNILIFPPILGLKYSCIILKLQLMTFPFQNLFGYQLQVFSIQICSRYIVHVLHRFSLQSARSRCHVKRHLAVLAFGHKMISILFRISASALFLKFRKFQPRYSYTTYKKKSVIKLLQHR